MKGYLVDTNVPSELTRETPDARVVAFLHKAGKESLLLSATLVMDSTPSLRRWDGPHGYPDIG